MRCPTWYQIAGAWALTWAKFQQTTLAGTFIRTQVLTRKEVGESLMASERAINGGLRDLESRQKALKKAHKWLHADQDFSGASPPLDAAVQDLPEATAEELSHLRIAWKFVKADKGDNHD